MIKVGQIYEQPNGEIYVITCIDEDENVHIIYKDGYTASYQFEDLKNIILMDKMLEECLTWRDAIIKLEEYDE